MKLLLVSLLVSLTLTVSPARGGVLDWFSSTPKGLYQNEDPNNSDHEKSLNFFSDSAVDITTSDGTFSGHYELKGDNLRVTITVLGTEQALYFTKVKQGFRSNDGTILRSPEYYKMHADAFAKSNQAVSDEGIDPLLAIKEFTAAIAIDPDYDDAYCSRGELEADDNRSKPPVLDYDVAIQDFTKAISINPQNVRAYGFRAKAKETKGDLDGAISDLEQEIKIDPGMDIFDGNRLSNLKQQKQEQSNAKNP